LSYGVVEHLLNRENK